VNGHHLNEPNAAQRSEAAALRLQIAQRVNVGEEKSAVAIGKAAAETVKEKANHDPHVNRGRAVDANGVLERMEDEPLAEKTATGGVEAVVEAVVQTMVVREAVILKIRHMAMSRGGVRWAFATALAYWLQSTKQE